LKRDWESKEMKGIFEHCRASGEKKVDWEAVREVPIYGYVEEVEKLKKRKFDEMEGEEDEGKVLDRDGLEKVLVDYRVKHEDVEAELGEDGESVKVHYAWRVLWITALLTRIRSNSKLQTASRYHS